MAQPRGLRNNNPLNIEKGQNFQGEIIPSQDARFAQFRTMAYGYRAAFKTLNTYATKHKCKVLKDFINRWAPPKENNTSGYVKTVMTRTGLKEDTPIDTKNEEQMCKIVSAMSYVENGIEAVTWDVMQGWKLYIGS